MPRGLAGGVPGASSKKKDTGTGRTRGDVLQAARADPVGALLVFLDLLERDAEMLAELLLAHPQHHATQTNPTADMDVDRIWLFLVGHFGSLACAAARRDALSAYLTIVAVPA